MGQMPEKFGHAVVVPVLGDMPTPAFVEPGPRVANLNAFRQKDPRREAFWCRRTFNISGTIPEFAELTVGKATYGTRVFLNGKQGKTKEYQDQIINKF